MTIRIVTSHPALQYVLYRTAPLGIALRCAARGARAKTRQYAIDLELSHGGKTQNETLGAWLPPHVQRYGVNSVEIDGRAVDARGDSLRRVLTRGRCG